MENFKIYLYSGTYLITAFLFLWVLVKIVLNPKLSSKYEILKSPLLKFSLILVVIGSLFNCVSVAHIPRWRELLFPVGFILVMVWIIYIHVKVIFKR